MIRPVQLKSLVIPLLSLLLGTAAYAQDTATSDGLLKEARKAAFEENNYNRAKTYLYKALRLSPDYADVRIFLGRIYAWTKQYDSGRICFTKVLAQQPAYEDASVAFSDLEFFSGDHTRSLALCREGLQYNPGSEALLFRQARALNALGRTEDATSVLQKLLSKNNRNEEALTLEKAIREARQSAKPDSIIIIPPQEPVINQDSLSADGLLLLARKAAFDENNYELAKYRLYKALHISPSYTDIKIFLGRIHSWTKQYDSAHYYFNGVLQNNPGHEDASLALADLEHWNDNDTKGLEVIETALSSHSASQALWVRKAKLLNALRRYAEAQVAIDRALQINRNDTEARSLANRIKESSYRNKIGLSYDYAYFDKQFADPWHQASFDYTRTTGIGSVIGRINYANRFKESGVQYELEAYPRISNTFYSYVGFGYSDKAGVFPQWRGGFSLYANLPASFEGELGFRYLKFSGDPTWSYTAYLGRYYKSWLFGARTYLTPSTYTSTVSASYNVSARYYYGSADDLAGMNIGYGISPDDRLNAIQLDTKERLVSYKVGFIFKKKVSLYNILSIDGSWFNQEYLPQTRGNQYQISVAWVRRF